MFLYEVRLLQGRSNRNWQRFFENVSDMNAKAVDHGGINALVLIKHHADEYTVKQRCNLGFSKKGDPVEVTEITKDSIENGPHGLHNDLIEYFLEYDNFPNIR